MFKLHGLVAAPFTAFERDGELNLAMIERQCEHLLANEVTGAFICGTTGESLSLTEPERMHLTERWADVADDALKVVVHVGHNSQRSAIDLARHATGCGVDAIAAMAPTFFKPASVSALIDFLVPVAAAAPSVPFYYYNIPKMTGVSFPVTDFLQAARARIPNLRGVKFTHTDLLDFARCQNFDDGYFNMAWGVDEMLLGALANGATAAVGSTYNFAAPLYSQMIRAYHAGDVERARQCSAKSHEMIAQLHKHGGGVRVGKAIMAMIGIDCGPTRAPIAPMTPPEIAAVRKAYEEIGFFQWAFSGKQPVSVAVPIGSAVN